MVTIWVESHGTTYDNEAQRGSGWKDVDLSETGKKQALELLERCRGRNVSAIFCSDLQRAVKTAVPTANALHIPVYPDERLRECDYGDMEGRPNKDIDAERPMRIKQPFPNGESYEQCLERMEPFFDWLSKNFQDKTVLIVSHKATHYGVEYFAAGHSVEKCIEHPLKWQPGWQYKFK